MSTGRNGPVDWSELRERANEFYEYAFLPPSYTNDGGGEEDTGGEPVNGPQKPPAEPRVVADPRADDSSVTDDALRTAQKYAGLSRERATDFYEYAFLPPSYTNDDVDAEPSSEAGIETDPDDFDGFVFTDWLETGRPAGPTKPPAEPRIVSEATAPTETTVDQDRRFEFVEWLETEELDAGTATPSTPDSTAEVEYGEFDFIEWLESGDAGFEPISISEEPAEPVEPDPEPATGPRLGIKPHPAKAATYALFVAMLTLAVLSVVGYAPILGPATGLGG
jgi:hypothetical protein